MQPFQMVAFFHKVFVYYMYYRVYIFYRDIPLKDLSPYEFVQMLDTIWGDFSDH